MDVSVVVPTYNEEKNIGACLQALKDQNFDGDYEVIVVDGHSTDKTVKLAKDYANIVIQQKSPKVAGARNDGFKLAKGKIFASIDADCIASRNWLKEITNGFKENPEAVCIFGDLVPSKQNGVYKFLFFLGNQVIKIASRTGLHHNICGANCAFRAKAFNAINGYRHLPICDDVEIGDRIKKQGRIFYYPNMKVIFDTRRMDKHGKYKQIKDWIGFAIKQKRGTLPKEVNYARENY